MTVGELLARMAATETPADRWLDAYVRAVDAGDVAAVLGLRRDAESDPELARAMADAAEGLEEEREDGRPR